LPHQRDGPVSQATTPGPEETERTPLLPLPEIPRKAFSPAPDSPPEPTTIRHRQRRPRGRGFSVRLIAEPGVDGLRAFRALLKIALRRFGLRAIEAPELEPSMTLGAGDNDGPARTRRA
jgi:hypothetical protein